jgi:hypothetical protein
LKSTEISLISVTSYYHIYGRHKEVSFYLVLEAML